MPFRGRFFQFLGVQIGKNRGLADFRDPPLKSGVQTPENGKKCHFPVYTRVLHLGPVFWKTRGWKEAPQKCHIALKIGFFRGNMPWRPWDPGTPENCPGPLFFNRNRGPGLSGPRNRFWGQKIAQTPFSIGDPSKLGSGPRKWQKSIPEPGFWTLGNGDFPVPDPLSTGFRS